MKIILILVLFNLQSGSEVITAEFDDARACDLAALRTFQGVTAEPDMRPLDPAEGASAIEGTVIAHDSDGAEIGMYSCNPSRSDRREG
ncbi:hypothetical protein SAMN05421853_12128 [Roseivivax halotolerans]|uniref:Uncharacterized protein n=1 Tax=Roseivivax halotolerans TaxID=93684 RepID=A0A1I6AIZ7_9RHOB|nr:hypothetical protein [Roseivivax halotolerans]SFQ68635.1 hypothetical protein SAMN05421853_12128 [Roseivivax halotolerans]